MHPRLMLTGESIVDLGAMEDLYAEWDALAVACALPQMSPAWVLAWWRALAPHGAAPRVVAVRDAGRLVGLAPFFVEPGRGGRVDYRLPGIELAVRLAPLALPGREWHVAETFAHVLARADPRPDAIALEGTPLASHWPAALCARWPGPVRAIAWQYALYGCPTVSLRAPSYEAWLEGKSASFRRETRRHRRAFLAEGGSVRMSTRATLSDDIAAFVRLHTARWQSLGASNLVARGERMPAMLEDVGESLVDQGRFRLMMLEIDGEPVSAHLALAAGGEVLFVNTGWDERFARLSPSSVNMLYALEHAFACGDRRVDLGLGEQAYKQRVADGDDPVAWVLIATPGRRLALTLLRSAPLLARYAVRDAATRALSAEQAQRLRAARRRLSGGAG
jgi:CelD/BcsL family acetyltransferase involved in cellulose biosynthesis